MARVMSPRCKRMRRFGTDLSLVSSVRELGTKCKLEVPPGQHGARRGKQLSDYGLQLRMKMMIKTYYGVLEKQFRRMYRIADQRRGATGDNLLMLLESRLDNVVYRLGFANTRAEARQLVSHKAIMVNGAVVNIPSFLLKPGDEVSIRERAREQLRIKAAMAMAKQREPSSWLNLNEDEFKGVFVNFPPMEELPSEFMINLIVELYSK
jgi:small subunit ribosomal protein S4